MNRTLHGPATMTRRAGTHLTPISGRPFDDTIDGYFPLQVSLRDMMLRNGFACALISLIQAPIMDVPGLPADAPVPLNINAGRAGIIDEMTLWIRRSGDTFELAGRGEWRWLAGENSGVTFDPMTRLAEPAFLNGIGQFSDCPEGGGLGGASMSDHVNGIVELRVTPDGQEDVVGTLRKLGWANARLWGPIPDDAGITKRSTHEHHFFGFAVSENDAPMLCPGRYILNGPSHPSSDRA